METSLNTHVHYDAMAVNDSNRKPYLARTVYVMELEADDLVLIGERGMPIELRVELSAKPIHTPEAKWQHKGHIEISSLALVTENSLSGVKL